jgi:two-component system chemotaxis response regulator CheB
MARRVVNISAAMAQIELIVIGASAGSLDGLLTIVKHLPTSLTACVIVVVHNNSSSQLPTILARTSALPVAVPEDGDPIVPGRILVAPPDYHVLVARGRVVLNRGPRENGFRPAIDPLFRTAARAYRGRVMGVILSGALDDGAYGMKVIKDAGGVTVVQDPDEAPIPSMPLNVIENVAVDHVASTAAMPELIARLTARGTSKGTVMRRRKEPEPQDPNPTEVDEMMATFGPPSGLTCPDCGGALWEIRDGNLVRYRCHTGHQFSPESLETSQRTDVEGALWTAVRALEEQAGLRKRMAERAQRAGLQVVHEKFAEAAQESHRQAAAIRELLFERPDPVPVTAAAPRPSRRPTGATTRGARAKRARRAG